MSGRPANAADITAQGLPVLSLWFAETAVYLEPRGDVPEADVATAVERLLTSPECPHR